MGLLAASALYPQSQGPLDGNAPSDLTTGRPTTVRYRVTDLGPVGGPPGQPIAIKNNGLIVGDAQFSGTAWHAMLWYGRLKLDIGKPGLGGPSSLAIGANERGQVVGQAETASSDPNREDFCGFGSGRVCQPFVWQNGFKAPLPPLGDKYGAAGRNAAAQSINNLGQVAGMAENTERDDTCPAFNPALLQSQQFKFKPVIWEKGQARELPTMPGDPDGIVFSINDKGQAVGGSGSCAAFQLSGDLTYLYSLHATLWQNGTVTDLGNLGGVAPGGGNTAIFINNRGQAIGTSGTGDGSLHAFLWSKATGIRDLGTVADDIASVGLGLNDGGDSVGISFDANFNPRAFLRRDGGVMVDLNTLIPADSSLFLFDACSINSSGEIIGIAVDSNGEAHGYLATPAGGGASDLSVAGPGPARFEYARKLLQNRPGTGRFGARQLDPR